MKHLFSQQSWSSLKRKISRMNDRDPVKSAIEPYRDWKRMLIWSLVGLLLVIATSAYQYWEYRNLKLVIEEAQKSPSSVLINKAEVLRVSSMLQKRAENFLRYQTE